MQTKRLGTKRLSLGKQLNASNSPANKQLNPKDASQAPNYKKTLTRQAVECIGQPRQQAVESKDAYNHSADHEAHRSAPS